MQYRLWPAQVAALLVGATLWQVSRLPEATQAVRTELAKRFSFSRVALPTTSTSKDTTVLPVNPKIAHIARWMSATGASAALGDMDDDGIANDLCYVEPRSGEVIASPVPGTGDRFSLFVVQTDPPLERYATVPQGCRIGDFNEDGLADLLVYYVGHVPQLFLRKSVPDGAPQPISMASYVAQRLPEKDDFWWTSVTFQADVDGDGHLDLVVGNYFPDGQQIFGKNAQGPVTMHDTFSRAKNGGTNRIYLWKSATSGVNPSVQYQQAENAFPGNDATSWTLAIGGADLNHDGLIELYFANDFGPDQLYLNTSKPGRVSFVRLIGDTGFAIPRSRVLGKDSFKGMGVDFGDINSDGFFDMFISNITVHGGLEESHFMFVSDGRIGDMAKGRAPYRDDGEALGVSRSSWGWDTRFADFDNDGELELMQATGFIKGKLNWWADLAEFANSNDQMVSNPGNWPEFPENIDISGHDKEPFYVRGSDGRYVDVSSEVGFDGAYNSRGLALGDVDADGDLDVVLANQWEDSWLFRNEVKNDRRFLGLRLMLSQKASTTTVSAGSVSARNSWPAMGAYATVKLPNGRTLTRQIDGGNGHSGACAAEALFGLGDVPPNVPLPVHVRWRDLDGTVRETDLELAPGWHTVSLASVRETGK